MASRRLALRKRLEPEAEGGRAVELVARTVTGDRAVGDDQVAKVEAAVDVFRRVNGDGGAEVDDGSCADVLVLQAFVAKNDEAGADGGEKAEGSQARAGAGAEQEFRAGVRGVAAADGEVVDL